MKEILFIFIFSSLITATIFTVVGLWELNAAPFSYPDQAFLYFLMIWALTICYWAVIGSIGYVTLKYFNLSDIKSYLLCGVACSIPMVIFTLNSREFEYVLSSLLSGVLSGIVAAILSKNSANKSLKLNTNE